MSNASRDTGEGRRPGRRDHYAWWEYVLMLFTVVLILGGAALLIRVVSAANEPAPVATASAPVQLDCPANGWFDAASSTCVPKAECATGTVWVEKTNTCGLAAPIVTGVAPKEGAAAGGTELTITGSGFTKGAEVIINGVTGAGTRVVNGTTIVTTTPPSDVFYPVDVQVTNADGQSDSLDNVFTYNAPPVQHITEIVPDTGSTDGGEAVIIKGLDFQPGAVVSFYGRAASDVEVLNANTIRATIPAAPAGPVSVNVRNPGMEAFTTTDAFTYVDQAPRVIMAVRPQQGGVAGGTEIVIAGTGFAKGAKVTIGGKPAGKVVVEDSTRITALTPKGTLGPALVAVRNPGVPAAQLPDGFEFVEAPTIETVEPAVGPQDGGTKVTISGTGFLDGAVVTVGEAPVEKVTVVDDTTIVVRTPPAASPIAVNVTVTNPEQPPATAKKAFTYEPTPVTKPTTAPLPRCRPLAVAPATTAAGQDLVLTDATLFAGAQGLTKPTLLTVVFSGPGAFTWQASPPRMVWTPPAEGFSSGVITFSYTDPSCRGAATGLTVAVSAS